ncbi:MAG: Fe-S protein assembly chaperone HscA [Saprospirales bacterium]|nr:Fe-S protein assembly chaperone HscA [Saprospirales bacterium]MBK8490191.1 Fe-S protein assembly chaperone HscA [Saprospirales bacterium]
MARIPINIKEGKVATEEDLIVGIDLGTTNSLVAYIKDGKSVAVKDGKGKSSLVPSIIHFTPIGRIEVGDEAKEKLLSDPANTIYSVKRLMGKSYKDVAGLENYFGYKIIDDDTESLVKIRANDRFFTPIELSAEILKALKVRVEGELGRPVHRAVITVPAYFNDAQRQATRDAGKLAGLDVLRIVNEPTAASLAYGLDKQNQEAQTIAVYDLGGGTFDISILHLHDGIFEVLSTNGDTFLGGDDFDRAIMDHWVAQYQLDPAELSQALRLKAEEAKKALSTEDTFQSSLNGYQVSLDRATFNALIQKYVQKTLDSCRQALKDAQLEPSQIDRVVMVGGTTRVPLIKSAVSAFFGKPVYDQLDPDEVVALGAAIQADVLAGNQKEVLLLDITPLSLGIETMGGLMDTIIPRNSKIPTKAGRQYTTSVDGQRNLKIAVYQGERDLVEHNRKLGEFILKGVPPMPAGLPKLEIQFILNADGILKVKARELRSNVEQEIEIRPSYGLSEEEMAKMLLESIQHAAEDMQVRGLLEARNEARNILLSADKFIRQNQEILSEEEVRKITEFRDRLQQATKGEDKDLINRIMEEINDFTRPLAQRAMDFVIAESLRGKKIND